MNFFKDTKMGPTETQKKLMYNVIERLRDPYYQQWDLK